jgi:dephospho-CoA kinase
MIYGLTGGIASGKSTVTKQLRDLGAFVVDADVWARRVVEPGSDGLREIAQVFGQSVLHPDGTLNRQALGGIIFHDSSLREHLNAITHPKIRRGMKRETTDYLASHPGKPVIWDVPLLFEGETRHLVDETILVYVPERVQLERLMARDGLSQEDAEVRISSQMPIEQKRLYADFIIDNAGDQEQTKVQVQQLWQTLLAATQNDPSSLSSADGPSHV